MSEHPNSATPEPSDRISLDQVFDRTPRDPSILVADGYGLRIQVERGHLLIHDGIGAHRRSRRLPRIERATKRILILGHTGGITLDALAWCNDVGISITQLDPATGHVLMAVGSTGRDDPRLRRAQALAATRPIGVTITRTLIEEKINRQAGVLRGMGEHRAADTLDRHAAKLATASMKTAPEIEATAANAYFAAWVRNVTITFANRDQPRIPDHWQTFDGRRSVLDHGRSARKAAAPINAILNYCYAIAEAECRIALIAVGLDPGLGILHTDQRARDSLALDIIEPIRPLVDATILDMLAGRRFRAADFHQTPAGQCRLLAPLTHELAESSRAWIPDINALAEYLANSIARDSPAPIRIRTPLTGANHKQAAAPNTSGRRTRKEPPAAAPAARTCRDCGATLTGVSRELCSTCWPVTRANQATQRALTGAASLAAQRAAGHDPTNTPAAQAKRRQSLITERAARAQWETNNPGALSDPNVYWEQIAPALGDIPLSRIVAATGVSISAASRIRGGKLLPHLRHWETLRDIAYPADQIPTPSAPR